MDRSVHYGGALRWGRAPPISTGSTTSTYSRKVPISMRHRFRFTAALLATGLLVAGCGDAPKKATKATDEYHTSIDLKKGFDPNANFTYGYVQYASSWDPIESVTGGDFTFFAPVYDRLLQQDDDGKVEPMLATEFTPAADLASMTLKLREGLTFSDGTPFDATAVQFNLDRARAKNSKISGELYQITSVDVVDPLTVKINVNGGLGSLATGLTGRAGMMVSPAAAQAGTIQTQPVGVGPYVTTEIVPGDHVAYKRTDGYWEPDAQNVATMTYKLITDDNTRYNALMAGQLDGASLNPDQLASAEKEGLAVITKPSAIFVYLALNTSKGQLGDPEVRKALNMAIDRKAISEGMYDGHCTPQIQPFPETSPGYSKKIGDGLDVFPYDPKAAKKILEEKGVKDLEITSVSPNVTIYTKFGEVIQAQLKEVGITVNVKSVPAAQVVQDFSIDKSVEATSSVFTGINDPDALSGRYLQPKALFNPGGAEYPELMKYAAEGAAVLDPAERSKAYEKMMDAWVDSPPHMLPVCMVHLAAAFQTNVSGVSQTASGAANLRDVAVAKK